MARRTKRKRGVTHRTHKYPIRMAYVKADTGTMKADEMVQYSSVIEAAMTGNPKFADPTPSLAEVSDARVALAAAIPAAAYGDRVMVAKRNSARLVLSKKLVDLCRYVNSASNGDRDVALTSGFLPAKTPDPIPLVDPPYSVSAEPTTKAGQALVRYRTHHGSRTKQIFATTGDPNDESGWQLVGVTTKRSFLATNLDPEKYYWFKVNVICAAGVSGYSDPAVVRAAA